MPELLKLTFNSTGNDSASVHESCTRTSSGPSNTTTWLDNYTYSVVIPAEMIIGFVVQTINFVLLKRSRIRGLRYTAYLRALCVTYLINIPFLIPVMLSRNNVTNERSYWSVFYTAHLLLFMINWFLQAGNLIIVALAIEPLRALLFPFKNLQRSEGGKRNIVVIFCLYLVVFVICIPMLLMHSVVSCPDGRFKAVSNADPILNNIRFANAVVFELLLIVLIMVVYTMLFLRYMVVRKKHAEHSVSQMLTTTRAIRTQHIRHQRATAMCLGSITAFLLCNLLSAVYECLSLYLSDKDESYKAQFFQFRRNFKHCSNIALMFNYTLNFIMQCLFSDQYRRELMKIICRRPIPSNAAERSATVNTPATAPHIRQKSSEVSANELHPLMTRNTVMPHELCRADDITDGSSSKDGKPDESYALVSYDNTIHDVCSGFRESSMTPIQV